MSLDLIVRDPETKATYRVNTDPDAELGRGALGVVYLGRLETGEGDSKVAVKNALPNLNEADLADFEGEADTLRAIRKTSAAQHVVWVHRGEDPDMPDRRILIMEYVPPDWRLAARKSEGRLPERLGLEVAGQCASLLLALHEEAEYEKEGKKKVGYTVRGDRKEADFYLRPDGTLLVLDWNRAKPIPDWAPNEQRQAFKQRDVQGFGQLLSDMMLGRSYLALPDLDDFSLPEWTTLSRGARKILYRACSSRQALRYPTAQALYAEAEAHLKRLDQAETNPEAVLRDCAQLKRQAESSDAGRALALAEQVLDLADAVFHFAPLESSAAERVGEYIRWARGKLILEKSETETVVDEVKRQIKQSDFKPAINTLLEELEHLHEDQERDLHAGLRLRRWLSLAQFAERMNVVGKQVGEAVDRLTKAVGDLETLGRGGVDQPLASKIKIGLGKEIVLLSDPELQSPLRPLSCEAAIRESWLSGVSADREGRRPQAEKMFGQAFRHWEELERFDPDYARVLRASLVGLDEWIAVKRKTIERQEQLKNVRADFTRLFVQIERALQDAANQENASWPGGIAAPMDEACSLHDEFPSSEAGSDQALPAAYHLLIWLRSIDTLLAQRDHIRALEKARRSASTEHPDTQTAALRLVVRSAIPELRRLAGQGTWLDELEQADRLWHQLRDVATTRSELMPANVNLEDLHGDLDQKISLQSKLRTPLPPPDPTDILESIDFDKRLRRAIEARLELYDRRVFPAGEQAAYRAEAVLALRTARRLVSDLQNLNSQLDKIAEELPATINTLRKFQPQLEHVSAAYLSVRSSLPGFEETLQRLNQVAAGLKEIRPKWRQVEESIGKFQPQAEQFGALTQTASKLVEEINRAADHLRDDASRVEFVRGLDAIPSLDRMLWSIRLLDGFRAARDLNLERTQAALDQARKIPSLTDSDRSAMEMLDGACKWLEKVKGTYRLKAWKDALEDSKLDVAEGIFAALRKDPLIDLNHWIVEQLIEQHRILRAKALRVPSASEIRDFPDQAWVLLRKGGELSDLRRLIEDTTSKNNLVPEDRELLARWHKRLEAAEGVDYMAIKAKKILPSTVVPNSPPEAKVKEKLDAARAMLYDVCATTPAEVFAARWSKWHEVAQLLDGLVMAAGPRSKQSLMELELVKRKRQDGLRILGVSNAANSVQVRS